MTAHEIRTITEDWKSSAMHKFSDSLPGRMLTVMLATLAASALAYLVFFRTTAHPCRSS